MIEIFKFEENALEDAAKHIARRDAHLQKISAPVATTTSTFSKP